MYFDTHAHLDDSRFKNDQQEVIERAKTSGVNLIMNIGCSEPSTWYNQALIAKYDFIYAAVGLHPHDARNYNQETAAQLFELAQRPRVRAIGEVGLDYHYDFSPRPQQQKVFREMISLARELGLPLIIHCRQAHQDLLQILKKEKGNQVGGVFHCYSGSWPLAQEIIKLGFKIALGGVVTFHNARKAVEVAREIPLEHLLLETDCPYLTPEPYRGQRNEPAYLVQVAKKIAAIKGITVAEVAEATRINGMRLFDIEKTT
ncbi:MAG TPA: TatD family hydrolase [Clostridia bacterium]|jgi:TatD DNase family protein|nr:TatD family hydrolase [Clostridia bacterium]